MSNNFFENISNEQNRAKYEIFSKRAAENFPEFKEAERFMRTDASIENEFRRIVKENNIAITKEDLDSLLRVSVAEKGAHFVATLEGAYIDTGDRVMFIPMTVSSMEGREESSNEWLSPELADGFRKRYPFDQLLKAFGEACTAAQENNIENYLDAQFKDKKDKSEK